ncbi:MAG: GTP cyclohydrolase I [Oscillospiraceae bacterium]|nr:GTP cyclohydrolase I [Oscillospiraceae bacterium]
MAIDQEKLKFHIRGILEALGEDPEREGLLETPERTAKMYAEMLEGCEYTNAEIAEMFGKTFTQTAGTEQDLVVMRDIEVFSFCEHHMALMYDMKVTIAYIPKGNVIGLSKMARIAEMAAKRLQLQERIGSDIAEIMQLAAGCEDVAVFIEGKHSCMTARGIKNTPAVTYTQTLRGRFAEDAALLQRAAMVR